MRLESSLLFLFASAGCVAGSSVVLRSHTLDDAIPAWASHRIDGHSLLQALLGSEHVPKSEGHLSPLGDSGNDHVSNVQARALSCRLTFAVAQ